jgi:hypothetical protein
MYPPRSRIALRASNRQRFFARQQCVGEQPIFSHLPVTSFRSTAHSGRYKPRAGCEAALVELVCNHLPPLRSEGLVTERPSIVMRTWDGTIVEVFEWVLHEAIAGAHQNPVVLGLWKRFEAVFSYETPSNMAEFQKMFSHFEAI